MLLGPAVAMAFPSEVAWGAGDFAIALALLSGTWLSIEIVLRFISELPGRHVLVGSIAFSALLIWAHLSVQVGQ
jgi:hypothetical protein